MSNLARIIIRSKEDEMARVLLKWSDLDGEKSYPLEGEEVVLGRKSDAGIVLSDHYVSRLHAKIVRGSEGHSLVDLGSTHGSFVNGQRVSQCLLSPGDRITLGKGRVDLHYVAETTRGGEETTLEDARRSMMDLTSVLGSAYPGYSDLEKLSFLLDFQYNVGRNFSARATFEQILVSALKISGAERGFILLAREEEEFGYVVGMDGQGRNLAQSEFVQASQTVVRQVAGAGEAVFMTEGIAGDLAQQDSIVAMKLRALACLPLKWIGSESAEPVVRGILYLDSTKMMHALSGLDQRILGKLGLEAGNVFEKLAMIAALEEKRLFEQELALARETQQSLLPASLPDVAGYEVLAFSHPTRHVGGDFYDFLDLESGRLTGVLADVSGKGISAALLSSLIQGALDVEIRSGKDLATVLISLNRFLCERTPANRFVTLFLFRLNPAGDGVFISAGHTNAFVYRAADAAVETLEPEHMILGAFSIASYSCRPLLLSEDDILVVYSDGLTEAANPGGDMFGEDRLVELIQREGKNHAESLEMAILESIEDFTAGRAQTDDITLMLVQKTG